MLAFLFCGEFLLHIPCWLRLYLGSFSYTSWAVFGLFGDILLHIPCWFCFYVGSFSYTSRVAFSFIWEVCLKHPVLVSSSFFHRGSFSYTSHAGFVFIWGVLHTHPMLAFLFCGEFLLHIPCWLRLYLGSLSYTSWAVFLLFGDILLHIPCWFCFYVGSFSYTSRAVLIFRQGDSLTLPVLPSSAFFFFFFFFSFWKISLTPAVLVPFLYRGSFSYTSHAGFIFIMGVSLTHTVLAGEFLLHIPWWLCVYVVSLTHPMLASFYAESFSYTSRSDFFF